MPLPIPLDRPEPDGGSFFQGPESIELCSLTFQSYLPRKHPSRPAGFSLVEVLIVLLVLGILSATGTGFYAHVIRDARLRTSSDTLAAFFAACQARAVQRGLPVTVELQGNRLTAAGSPSLSCPLPPLDAPSLGTIAGLRFAADRTLTAAGKPITDLPLALRLPDGGLVTFTLAVGPR